MAVAVNLSLGNRTLAQRTGVLLAKESRSGCLGKETVSGSQEGGGRRVLARAAWQRLATMVMGVNICTFLHVLVFHNVTFKKLRRSLKPSSGFR